MNIIRKYIRFAPPLIIFLFRATYYLNYPIIGEARTDSSSYINYSFFQLSGYGARTPLYPLIIRICKILTGESHYLFATACVQILISAVAVFFLYKAIYMATDNQLISSIITILYGCSSCISYWDVCILSESLAISVSAFFLYAVVKYVKYPSFKNGTIAILFSLIATGIKPTLAVYSGVCLVLLLLQFFLQKDMRRMILKLASVLGVVILIYVGYSYNNWVQYGTFNLTNIGPRHSLVPCLVTGNYLNYPDQSLVSKIDSTYNAGIDAGNTPRGWDTTTPIMELFGSTERERNINVSAFTSYCIKTDLGAYLRYLFDNIISYWNRPYYINVFSDVSSSSANMFSGIILFIQRDLSFFEVGTGFYMIAFSFCATLYIWLKKKKCPWFYLGIWGALTVIEVSVFLGSYDDFQRLTVYVLPFIYFGWGIILNDIAIYSQQTKSSAESPSDETV